MLVAFDAVALLFVLWLSYSLRLGGRFVPTGFQLILMLLAPVIALPIFARLGLYRSVIRYLPERAVWTVLRAMTLATGLWFAVLLVAELVPNESNMRAVPRSIPAFYWFFGVIVLAGSRFAAKAFLWPQAPGQAAARVLVYGAGSAGTQLANALRAEGSYMVMGFLDDDPGLQGRDVSGLRVYAPDRLAHLIENTGVREVIISIPSADAATRQEIVTRLAHFPVKIRTLPAISDLITGKYIVSQLREIDIDDLLGRSSVPADPELLRAMLHGRTILVSGAGGTIGSELSRLIAQWSPKKLVLLDLHEHALYQIERKVSLDASFPVVPVLGSVTDKNLLDRTLVEHQVQVLFHAAAHKHVPLVEANALEGIRNNIFGTKVIAQAAYDAGVSHFVLISTDKAVRPSSVMGATKRWAELIVRQQGALADQQGTGQRFCAVRFGNVLGSNGSVVPLFREQISHGGPLTLTHGEMERYFMSIHEAAELIVQAGALSEGGDIFVLEMGEPVRIRDLAENMIRLAGLTVRSEESGVGDISIVTTAMRPGEKLTEELFYEPSLVTHTRHPKILRVKRSFEVGSVLEHGLNQLEATLFRSEEGRAREILFDLVRH